MKSPKQHLQEAVQRQMAAMIQASRDMSARMTPAQRAAYVQSLRDAQARSRS